MASCWPDASVNVYVIVEAVLLLLCRIWPPTVLNWPLKLTPFVRWTTIVTVRAVSGLVLARRTSSSSNQGLLDATTPVAVMLPPVWVGEGVGVGGPVGLGVGGGVRVGRGRAAELGDVALEPDAELGRGPVVGGDQAGAARAREVGVPGPAHVAGV